MLASTRCPGAFLTNRPALEHIRSNSSTRSPTAPCARPRETMKTLMPLSLSSLSTLTTGVHGMAHGCLLRWWLPSLVSWSTTWPSALRAPSKHKHIHNHYLTTGSLKTEFWWRSTNDPSSSVVASLKWIFATCSALGRGARVAVFVFFFFLFRLCLYVTSLINLQMDFIVSFFWSIWMEFCNFFDKTKQ